MGAGQQQELTYGRIIWASVTDRHGHRKVRPCIVMTPTDKIQANRPLLVMAITTTFADPPPPWHVPLPWNPDPRRVGTRLAQRSAAVVEWLDLIRPTEVLDIKGNVPRPVMALIERALQERATQELDED